MLQFRKHFNMKIPAMILAAALILQSFSFVLTTDIAKAEDNAAINVAAKAAILIEAGSGQTLFEMNANTPLPPASMAKMMTEYLVLEKIKKGAIQWNSQVTVSKTAANVGGSGQLLAAGETYTVEDLFKALSVYSSNDAAVALAEYIGGSIEKFAQMMNQEAKTLGLSDQAYFIDPTGLDRSDLKKMIGYDPGSLPGETQLTAHDCAILAQHIVMNHPEALKYTSETDAYLKPGDERYHMKNWNHMLAGWKTYKNGKNNYAVYAYPGVDGLKTGTTDRAGACFTGTAERNGIRLITVVMGVAHEPNPDKRFMETAKMLDYGFNNFEKKTILTAKSQIDALKKVNVKKGVQIEVPLVTENGAQFIIRKGDTEKDFTLKAVSKPENEIVAPIKKGDVLGKLTVTYNKNHAVTQTINLIAAEDVEKAGWWRLLFRGMGNFFKDLLHGIKNLF